MRRNRLFLRPALGVVIRHSTQAFKERESIGMWSPPARGDADGFVRIVLHGTHNPETAERWRAELAAGRLPQTNGNAP